MPKILDVLTLLQRDENPPTYSQLLNGYLYVRVCGGKRKLFFSNDDGEVIELTPCLPEIDLVNGGRNVYVNGLTGLDTNDGLTALTAFQTIQHAVDSLSAALEASFDVVNEDLIVNIMNIQAFPEDVAILGFQKLRKRLIIKGADSTLVVLHSGAATAASAVLLTDAGAAFGIVPLTGYILEWTVAGTTQRTEIATSTNTTLRPVVPFSIPPIIGSTYRVLQPGVSIEGDPATILPVLTINQSVGGHTATNASESFFGDGPCVILAYLTVNNNKPSAPLAIRQDGGNVYYAGVVLEGTGEGLYALGGDIICFGLFGEDPVFGLAPGDFTTLAGLSLGIRTAGLITSMRIDNGNMIGQPALFGVGGYYLDGSAVFIFGGSAVVGAVHTDGQARLQFSVDPTLPFLIALTNPAASAYAIYNELGTIVRLTSPVEFDQLGVAVGAIFCDKDCYLQVSSSPVCVAGDVPGNGITCMNGSRVQVGAGVAFAVTGTELICGTATGIFAGLAAATPVQDIAPATPGSFASIFRA